jgi:hypothetical protein
MSNIPPHVQARAEHLRKVVNDPPDHARPVAFMYRQAVANRQQGERRLQEARDAAVKAEADLLRAQGSEAALCDAVLALVPMPVVEAADPPAAK